MHDFCTNDNIAIAVLYLYGKCDESEEYYLYKFFPIKLFSIDFL